VLHIGLTSCTFPLGKKCPRKMTMTMTMTRGGGKVVVVALAIRKASHSSIGGFWTRCFILQDNLLPPPRSIQCNWLWILLNFGEMLLEEGVGKPELT